MLRRAFCMALLASPLTALPQPAAPEKKASPAAVRRRTATVKSGRRPRQAARRFVT
jgi:hypothetical protein